MLLNSSGFCFSINWTRDFFDSEEYHTYYEYLQETEDYGTYLLVPSFYVILPCGVGMLFAGVYVLMDLLSKDIVETTVVRVRCLCIFCTSFYIYM